MASCFKENSVKIIRFKIDHMIIYNSSRNMMIKEIFVLYKQNKKK